MLKKKLLVIIGLVAVAGLSACGAPQEKSPDYADDEAMQVIAQGLEKRSDIIDAQDSVDSNVDLKSDYIEAVEAEIAVTKPLKDRQFEDSKLQEKVVAYVNTLDDSLEVLEKNGLSDTDFYTKWYEVLDERTALIKEFVDDYGLAVKPKYQDVLDELVATGAGATERRESKDAINSLVTSATWDKIDEGYGSYTYVAVIENSTEFDFNDVNITLGLYDADGVRAAESYASTQKWNKGEKVRFEAYGDVDAARVDAAVDFFDVADGSAD